MYVMDLAIKKIVEAINSPFRGGISRTLAAAIIVITAIISANPAIAGYAAIVIDADSGRVLHSRNADTPKFPASLTKMMTLYLAFEALEKGQLRLDQRLRVSKRAAGQPASKLGLKEGETISVDDAIRAMSVKSANDVATVLAEAMGGTEIKFAQMMTKKARALGMTRTSFRNASGLPNRRQKSTARDMAILAQALIDRYPRYYGYFSQASFQYNGKRFKNHNSLLKNYAGTDGIKTGYIRASGFNLVASAERDGIRLIGVVFGGKTAVRRDRQMQRLFNRSWDRARSLSTANARPIPKPPVPGSELIAGGSSTPALAGASIAPIKRPVPPTILDKRSPSWGIQIGAFAGSTDAHIAAGNVVSRLSNLPVTAALSVQPVRSSTSTLYRARLMGMDEATAQAACRQLVKNAHPCILVTPQGDALARLPQQ